MHEVHCIKSCKASLVVPLKESWTGKNKKFGRWFSVDDPRNCLQLSKGFPLYGEMQFQTHTWISGVSDIYYTKQLKQQFFKGENKIECHSVMMELLLSRSFIVPIIGKLLPFMLVSINYTAFPIVCSNSKLCLFWFVNYSTISHGFPEWKILIFMWFESKVVCKAGHLPTS